MLAYIVKRYDTPESIARYFTGNPARFTELVAANPQLRRKIVGKDMITNQFVTTFLDTDFYEKVRLNLPASWKAKAGMVMGAGSVGASGSFCSSNSGCQSWETCENGACYDPGSDPVRIAEANACAAGGGDYDYGTRKCTKYTGPDQTAYCNDPALITVVQKALIANGNDVGPHGADGQWGCDSQKALDASGRSFMDFAKEHGWTACAGAVPYKAGCGATPGPLPKKKLGEDCKDGSECETGLVCENGKCANPPANVTKSGSSAWLYILGGLGAAALVVGVAYGGGAFDDKGKTKPKEPKANPAARIARITSASITKYRDNGQTKAYVSWVDSKGEPGGTGGDPHNAHMEALLARAKREGVSIHRVTH
jgi:hypothetical protein